LGLHGTQNVSYFREANSVLESTVPVSNASASSSSQKWQQYFKVCSQCENLPEPANIFRIVYAALSIPGSSALCERVFIADE